jgi:hypothetical protein
VVNVRAETREAVRGVPWRDVRSARNLLDAMACTAAARHPGAAERSAAVDPSRLASWLEAHELAALAFGWSATADPELAANLKNAAAGAAAGNLAHFATLDGIEKRLASDSIPMVLLKGAAVACSAYRDPSLRPMSDLDIWIREDDMPRAAAALGELGFRQVPGLLDRPSELQKHSCGELVFRKGPDEHGLVELHYGAFPGWWIQRTAVPDSDGVWSRRLPMGPGRHASRLAAEDAILQTAFHVAVNQFGQMPLRGMMDLAVLSRAQSIDWCTVADRAVAWRLGTATWLVLDTANRLIGLPGCGAALSRLRPSPVRRAALRAFVTPFAILSGRNLTRPPLRHAFMLALVDRLRDGARLVGRTAWPEPWWIHARYGRPVGRVAHLWGLVGRGTL